MRMQVLVAALVTALLVVFVASVPSFAQSIPVPANPVLFCGVQAPPAASTYQVSVDGGAMQALTMDATVDALCPSGSTHSFRLAAALFTVGDHTVRVRATNAFGSTDGPVYTVTVGIAPGSFTINAVNP